MSVASPPPTSTPSGPPTPTPTTPTTTTTAALRVTLAIVITVAITHKSEIDTELAFGWSWLREQPFFKNDSFEPIVATLSFFPPLIFFYTLDMLSATNSGRWLRRYQ